MNEVSMPTALEVLRNVFGFRDFVGPQETIIDTLVSGGDAVVLMPTGGGKSMCYQIPALLRPGTAVVVSPLIALMRDQVQSLTQNGVRAACLNSSLSAADARGVESELLAGRLDLIYVAPERLFMPGFLTSWRAYRWRSSLLTRRIAYRSGAMISALNTRVWACWPSVSPQCRAWL